MKNNFLEIKSVDFTIGGKPKVKNASFVIENEGETLCILGPSGIGKTTILRTIAGLQKLESGQIFLKNKLLSSEKEHVEPEKRNIALSFQDNSLFPNYNVIENINFGKKRANRNSFNFKTDNISSLLNTCLSGSLIIVFNFLIIGYLKNDMFAQIKNSNEKYN